MIRLEKKILNEKKKHYPSQSGLTRQICDPSHEIIITP